MKKIRAAVNENDCIVIDIIDHERIQYFLVEARTGRKRTLGDPVEFSLSVKNYFGVKGKTIRELYRFTDWHNPKLKTELYRIWRMMDTQLRQKESAGKSAAFMKEPAIFDNEMAA